MLFQSLPNISCVCRSGNRIIYSHLEFLQRGQRRNMITSIAIYYFNSEIADKS